MMQQDVVRVRMESHSSFALFRVHRRGECFEQRVTHRSGGRFLHHLGNDAEARVIIDPGDDRDPEPGGELDFAPDVDLATAPSNATAPSACSRLVVVASVSVGSSDDARDSGRSPHATAGPRARGAVCSGACGGPTRGGPGAARRCGPRSPAPSGGTAIGPRALVGQCC